MNVYEVEIASEAPGFRLLQHVRAVDEVEAQQKVQNIQGPDAILSPKVVLRRPCTVKEIAEEQKKPVLDTVPLNVGPADVFAAPVAEVVTP